MKKTIAATITAAAALLGAGTAHADTSADMAFINVLHNRGITSTNGNDVALIAWGKAACNSLDSGSSPTAVARALYLKTEMGLYDSGYFLGAAISAYCPWNRVFID